MAMKKQQREDLLASKDICFDEGTDQECHFRIYKMPASDAEEWIGEVICLAARCGIPIPREFDNAVTEWAGKLSTGEFILRLQDLNFPEVRRIMNMLFKYVRILQRDPETGEVVNMPEATLQNINAATSKFQTIFKLRLQVIGYNYGFFDNAEDLVSKIQDLKSRSQTTQTSAQSPVRLSVNGEPKS